MNFLDFKKTIGWDRLSPEQKSAAMQVYSQRTGIPVRELALMPDSDWEAIPRGIAALGGGLASGVTLGITKPEDVGKWIGGESGAALMRQAQGEHPLLTLLGEFAGTAVPFAGMSPVLGRLSTLPRIATEAGIFTGAEAIGRKETAPEKLAESYAKNLAFLGGLHGIARLFRRAPVEEPSVRPGELVPIETPESIVRPMWEGREPVVPKKPPVALPERRPVALLPEKSELAEVRRLEEMEREKVFSLKEAQEIVGRLQKGEPVVFDLTPDKAKLIGSEKVLAERVLPEGGFEVRTPEGRIARIYPSGKGKLEGVRGVSFEGIEVRVEPEVPEIVPKFLSKVEERLDVMTPEEYKTVSGMLERIKSGEYPLRDMESYLEAVKPVEHPEVIEEFHKVIEELERKRKIPKEVREKLQKVAAHEVTPEEFLEWYSKKEVRVSTEYNPDRYKPLDYELPKGITVGEKGIMRAGFSEAIGSLKRAKKLESLGHDWNTILKETHWYRAPDGKWRTWLGAVGEFNPDAKRLLMEKAEVKLPEVYADERLYKAYPELRRVPVIPDRTVELGGYSPAKKEIRINPNLNDRDFSSTIVHETYHAIEHAEGLDTGTAPDNIKNLMKAYTPVKRKLRQYVAERRNLWPEVEKIVDSMEKYEKILTKAVGKLNEPGISLGQKAELRSIAEEAIGQLEATMEHYREAAYLLKLGEYEARFTEAKVLGELAGKKFTFVPEYVVDKNAVWVDELKSAFGKRVRVVEGRAEVLLEDGTKVSLRKPEEAREFLETLVQEQEATMPRVSKKLDLKELFIC